MKKLLFVVMFLLLPFVSHAGSAAAEFLVHTLGLDTEQAQTVSKVLSQQHVARKALRSAGMDTCDANVKLRNSTRDKIAAVLSDTQLEKYDAYQRKRYGNQNCS